MKLLIHSQTSTLQALKFGDELVTCLDIDIYYVLLLLPHPPLLSAIQHCFAVYVVHHSSTKPMHLDSSTAAEDQYTHLYAN